MKFKLQPYNLQELGQRQNQEDSLFPGIGEQMADDRLFILCDGMGGHEKGEVASATVCQAMSNYLLSRWNPTMTLSDDFLREAISAAYDMLDSKDNGEAKKMGTTMTFLCFHAGGVTIAHIGDSRVYHIRPAKDNQPARIMFVTRDHSLVNDLVKIGEITEEEAKHHPQKNVITRAMQPCQERRCKADIMHITDVQPGDFFYMCSDGMLEQTEDDDLVKIITNPNWSESKKVEVLHNVTEDNHDNHTAHLIKVEAVEGAPVVENTVVAPKSIHASSQTRPVAPQKEAFVGKQKDSKMLLKVLIAVLVVVLAVMLGFYLMNNDKEKDINKEAIEQCGQLDEDSDNSVVEQATSKNTSKTKKEKKQDAAQVKGQKKDKDSKGGQKAKSVTNVASSETSTRANTTTSDAKKTAAELLKKNKVSGSDKVEASKTKQDLKAKEAAKSDPIKDI